jgi:hypothetical protein
MPSKLTGTRLYDRVVIECECGRRMRAEEVIREYFKIQRREFRKNRPGRDAEVCRQWRERKRQQEQGQEASASPQP